MFVDFYTQLSHKGTGLTDHKGVKIHSDTVICLYGVNKSVIVSKFDPNTIIDVLYPDRYLYKGMPDIIELKVVMDKKEYSFGYTSEPQQNLIPVINENRVTSFVSSVDQLKDIPNIIEHFPSGHFCHKVLEKKLSIHPYEQFTHPKFDKASYKESMKFGSISPTNIISEGKPYSIGIEIETFSGYIPVWLRKNLNIDCQYDGSIRDANGNKDTGGEYTTGVLRGDNGFAHLYKIVYELSRRCKINNTCSIHVHLGNIIFNKEQTVLLYKVLECIEDELFSMMPASRRVREHCRPMKKLRINLKKRGVPYDILIDKYYDTIVKMVSLGQSAGPKINKSLNHPQGRYCNYDRSTPRYWWCNFVPALFNIKGPGNHTIELRNHSATLEFTKIKNWILICMGIVSYVENFKHDIIDNNNISLKEILYKTYPKKGKYLYSYVQDRKRLFMDSPMSSINEDAEYNPKNNVNEPLASIREIL